MQDQKDTNIFYTIFYYCALIILGPVTIFFSTKVFLFDGLLGTNSVSSNVWSAIISVVALHIIVGMYIYRAYSESSKVKPDKID